MSLVVGLAPILLGVVGAYLMYHGSPPGGRVRRRNIRLQRIGLALATLAERVDCHATTVWRALQAARDLGLVQWTERRVRAAWRSLRTSNWYWLTTPEAPVEPRPRTSMQRAEGGEREEKQAAREGSRTVLAAMLAEASRLPDLLKARRDAWAAGMVARRA